MSTVRGEIFEGGNTEKSLEKMNTFLKGGDVSYVDVKEISNCRFLLMYSKKRKKKDLSVFDLDVKE